MMNNIIEIKLGKLVVKEGLATIRKMLLVDDSHKCSDCPICHRVYSDQAYHSCDCDYYKYTHNNYDWDTLKESLITEGYKYNEGYMIVKKVNNTYTIIEGNHRTILLKEIHDDDYMIKVRTITPESEAVPVKSSKS